MLWQSRCLSIREESEGYKLVLGLLLASMIVAIVVAISCGIKTHSLLLALGVALVGILSLLAGVAIASGTGVTGQTPRTGSYPIVFAEQSRGYYLLQIQGTPSSLDFGGNETWFQFAPGAVEAVQVGAADPRANTLVVSEIKNVNKTLTAYLVESAEQGREGGLNEL